MRRQWGIFAYGGKGFNPRICKRCDYYALKNIDLSQVSIHASVKDATFINQ